MENDNPYEAALGKTREEEPPEEEDIPNKDATPKRRGKKGHTVYVDLVTHAAIQRVKKRRKMTAEELWLEGMNYVLANSGEKAIS